MIVEAKQSVQGIANPRRRMGCHGTGPQSRIPARPGEACDKAKLNGSSEMMKTIGIVVVAALAAKIAAEAPVMKDRTALQDRTDHHN
jgi:hypothetical protein